MKKVTSIGDKRYQIPTTCYRKINVEFSEKDSVTAMAITFAYDGYTINKFNLIVNFEHLRLNFSVTVCSRL